MSLERCERGEGRSAHRAIDSLVAALLIGRLREPVLLARRRARHSFRPQTQAGKHARQRPPCAWPS
eukprot:663427-Pyramimonas_sp.AAC.1